MSLLIKGPPKFVPLVYPCWAILEAVNVTVAKPATVRRTWEGADYVFDRYVPVDYSDQYQDREQVIARIVETLVTKEKKHALFDNIQRFIPGSG